MWQNHLDKKKNHLNRHLDIVMNCLLNWYTKEIPKNNLNIII